jgi:hypothetical protein
MKREREREQRRKRSGNLEGEEGAYERWVVAPAAREGGKGYADLKTSIHNSIIPTSPKTRAETLSPRDVARLKPCFLMILRRWILEFGRAW